MAFKVDLRIFKNPAVKKANFARTEMARQRLPAAGKAANARDGP